MSHLGGDWTVAAYLAGGENVSREMIPALHDMRDSVLRDRDSLRVLAQFEPDATSPRLFAFGDAPANCEPALRATRPGEPTPFDLASHEYVVPRTDREAKPLSAIQRLEDFIQRARAHCSGRKLMLVISGHGSGAVGEFLGYRSNGDPLYVTDLEKALGSAHASSPKIDILGLDCCNMSMVEVAFELAPHARLMVASEGYVLNHGWPYGPMLNAIADLQSEAAGAEIVRQFVRSYSDYALLNVSSHCALCRLDDIELLTAPMRRLSERLLSSIQDPDVWRPVVLAHWEAQSYKDEEYVDLGDFCGRLRMHIADQEVQAACAAVIEGLERVVAISSFSGSAFQYSTGLSIYFPWCNDTAKCSPTDLGATASPLQGYKDLRFSRATLWGEFLDAYLVATRRDPPRRSAWAMPVSPGHPATAGITVPPGVAVEPSGEPLPIRHKPSGSERSRSRLENCPHKQKEAFMAIKRFPPWNSKGGAAAPRPTIKNHPRDASESGQAEALPVRRFPPWNSKGQAPVSPSSTIKNHPHENPFSRK